MDIEFSATISRRRDLDITLVEVHDVLWESDLVTAMLAYPRLGGWIFCTAFNIEGELERWPRQLNYI
jgi:hypothetical protein